MQLCLFVSDIAFLDEIQDAVQAHGNKTQDQNGHKNRSQLEGLAGVYNQIAQSLSGADKFSDDHAYQAKADVYLHDT